MFLRLLWLTVFAVIYTTGSAKAGVIRADAASGFVEHKPYEALLIETQPGATATDDEEENSTFKVIVQEPEVAFSRDEDMSVKIAPASLDPAPGTVEKIEITLDASESSVNDEIEKRLEAEEKRLEEEEKQLDEEEEKQLEVALSRDEDASVKLTANIGYDAESMDKPQKFAKLLLLSTPRLTKEQEENIEEPEDVGTSTEVSNNETTERNTEATESNTEMQSDTEQTITDKKDDNVDSGDSKKEKSDDKDEESFITRLFGVRDKIFGTKASTTDKAANDATPTEISSKNNKTGADEDKKNVAVKKNSEETPIAAEQPAESHSDNIASAVLIETEPDYVIVDSEVEQLGSFTHADSAEHLQPIVHSVEVVPTYFDEPLLVSYVHTW